jgi:clan AA aspartic protease
MGLFHVRVELGNLEATRFESVEALVDTGATYLRAPRQLLTRLGVSPQERQAFRIADGSEMECDIGQVMVRFGGRTRYTVVIFGDDDAQPLLGALALEAFSLGIDPVNKRLTPVPGYMM